MYVALDKGGPAKVTFKLPRDCLSRYIKECVEKHYWKSLEDVLLGGGGHRSFAKGEGGIATDNCDLKEISLFDVIKSDPKPKKLYKLISAMIDHGSLVNGRNEKDIPLVSAINRRDHDLAIILLKKNANPEGIIKSKFGRHDDTPVHTAFRIGLASGMSGILIMQFNYTRHEVTRVLNLLSVMNCNMQYCQCKMIIKADMYILCVN